MKPPSKRPTWQINVYIPSRCHIIGVRDCPYGICCPWVRGGWDLDALGNFFRRRRRRRPRPLLFRQILKQNRHFQSFLMKMTFWGIFYLEGRLLKMFSNCFPLLQGEVE